jgi:hypothetical protein
MARGQLNGVGQQSRLVPTIWKKPPPMASALLMLSTSRSTTTARVQQSMIGRVRP